LFLGIVVEAVEGLEAEVTGGFDGVLVHARAQGHVDDEGEGVVES